MGKHYQEDVFKPLLFCNGKYQISRFGELKSIYTVTQKGYFSLTGTILKISICNTGYKRICLYWYENGIRKKKQCYIHQLVAKAFLKPVEGKDQVNHIDCNKLNNHVSNLEWCTVAENNKHAKENGLFDKIPKEIRLHIKENYNGYNKRQLAKKFNLSKATIYRIGTNRDGRGEIKVFDRIITIPAPKSKVVIDTATGEKITAKEVSKRIGKSMKETYKLLGGYEGKVNTTQYKYTGGYMFNS